MKDLNRIKAAKMTKRCEPLTESRCRRIRADYTLRLTFMGSQTAKPGATRVRRGWCISRH